MKWQLDSKWRTIKIYYILTLLTSKKNCFGWKWCHNWWTVIIYEKHVLNVEMVQIVQIKWFYTFWYIIILEIWSYRNWPLSFSLRKKHEPCLFQHCDIVPSSSTSFCIYCLSHDQLYPVPVQNGDVPYSLMLQR